jgi:hypothetical protein
VINGSQPTKLDQSVDDPLNGYFLKIKGGFNLKKLLVVLLTVALVLSLAVMANAAPSIWMGGNVSFEYVLSGAADPTQPMNWAADSNMQLGNLSFTASDDTTWATIKYDFNTWGAGSKYGLGFKKLGGMVDISLTTYDLSTTLRGQINAKRFDVWGGDPLFCNRPGNILAIGVDTDSFAANVEYRPNQAVDGVTEFWLAATAKFDTGKAYLGYSNETGAVNEMIVGAEIKLDALTINADYYTVGTATQIFQASVNLTEAKTKATLYYDLAGSIYGLTGEYTGIEKVTLGAKYFSDSTYEVYAGYKVGVINLRLDYLNTGKIGLGLQAGIW